jgi:hypothetical protein
LLQVSRFAQSPPVQVRDSSPWLEQQRATKKDGGLR